MIDLITDHIIPAAMAVLPPQMDSMPARAMLVAIGLQESRFLARRQHHGPALGFWQFEVSGVRGVRSHAATREPLKEAMRRLRYPHLQTDPSPFAHEVLEHNDVLAAVFARLLLWTVPGRLPQRFEAQEGWRQYLSAWNPGKPHPSTWETFFDEAWARVTRHESGT